jgi:hypothetical protein
LYICFLSLVNRRKIFAKRSQDNIIKWIIYCKLSFIVNMSYRYDFIITQ